MLPRAEGGRPAGQACNGDVNLAAGMLLGDNIVRVNRMLMAGLDERQAAGAIAGAGCVSFIPSCSRVVPLPVFFCVWTFFFSACAEAAGSSFTSR